MRRPIGFEPGDKGLAGRMTTDMRDMRRGGESPNRDRKLFLQAVDRAVRVMEAYSVDPRPLSLTEVAAAAGIDKSSAQRICFTLQELGYLERAGNDQGYLPGKKFLDRSFDYLRLSPLIERATPVLSELRKTTQERVDLSLFDDTTIVYAIRLQSARETFFATLVGRRIPTFNSSGGRAMLARLKDAEVTDILRRSARQPMTPKTITSIPCLMKKIREIRRVGYGLVVEEGMFGEMVIGAAVTTTLGRPVAAIHVAVSLANWKPDAFCKKVAPLVMEAAQDLSQ